MLLQIKLDGNEEKILKDIALLNQRTPTWTAKKIILDGLKNKGFKNEFVYELPEKHKESEIKNKKPSQEEIDQANEAMREEYDINGRTEKFEKLQKKYIDMVNIK